MATVIRGSDNFDTSDNATQTELDALSTGKVLQVVTSNSTSNTATSSTTFIDTPFSVTITPSSTSSKILLTWSHTSYISQDQDHCISTVFRGNASTGTNLGQTDWGFSNGYARNVGYGSAVTNFNHAGNYLDSPSTTSAVTYTLAFRSYTGNTVYSGDNGGKSVITAMEIAG